MFSLKNRFNRQTEVENQEYIFPDTQSKILLGLFYLFLITAGFMFYNFVIVPEAAKIKLLDFGVRYEIMGLWIKFILGFFLVPSAIMVLFGIKIICEKRYPSLGARVAVKTKIIRGKDARKIGISYLIFGIISIIIIFISMERAHRFHKSFMENPLSWATEKAWNDAGFKKPAEHKKKPKF